MLLHYLVAQLVKNLPASAGDPASITGWGRSLGEGNGNPLQYSCLEDPMDRGAWQATDHGTTENWTWLRLNHHYAILVLQRRSIGYNEYISHIIKGLGYHSLRHLYCLPTQEAVVIVKSRTKKEWIFFLTFKVKNKGSQGQFLYLTLAFLPILFKTLFPHLQNGYFLVFIP